jgi:hypothetical protein
MNEIRGTGRFLERTGNIKPASVYRGLIRIEQEFEEIVE